MPWDWIRLGEEVERARSACVPTWEPGDAEAARRLEQAWDAAWPPGFFDQLQRCKRGEPGGLDQILDFIEACPRFFRTGYLLNTALRWLPRSSRSEAQAERMRGLVLASVGRRLRVPFQRIPSLACAIDSPALRVALRALLESPDPAVRARAIAVLDRLPGVPWDLERVRLQREERRLGSMIVTAKRTRSALLLRRVLTLDPRTMTSRNRHLLAVAFEFTMNWGLLPDEELLAIARRIDGSELEPIWRWALPRKDAPGERARWLRAQLRAT